MKELVRKVDDHRFLFRDKNNGIAWIEDHSTGLGVSVHPNIDVTGSVEGMKKRGFWRRNDRTIRSHGWIYNIDRFVCDSGNKMEVIVAEECMCQACIERKEKEKLRKGFF